MRRWIGVGVVLLFACAAVWGILYPSHWIVVRNVSGRAIEAIRVESGNGGAIAEDVRNGEAVLVRFRGPHGQEYRVSQFSAGNWEELGRCGYGDLLGGTYLIDLADGKTISCLPVRTRRRH
jgi:hypothetical protein